MIGEPYTCSLCRGEFVKGRPDDEAMAEFQENYGNIKYKSPDDAEPCIVCNNCFKIIITAYPPEMHAEDVAAGIERKIELP